MCHCCRCRNYGNTNQIRLEDGCHKAFQLDALVLSRACSEDDSRLLSPAAAAAVAAGLPHDENGPVLDSQIADGLGFSAHPLYPFIKV